MILPVYLYGLPVLRQEAQAVSQEYPDLKKLEAKNSISFAAVKNQQTLLADRFHRSFQKSLAMVK